MATAKQQVAVVEDKFPPALYDYAEDEGAGFEGQTQEDYALPWLVVLQANSKPVRELDDAKAGQLYNTVTGTLTKGSEGISFVPAFTQHVFVEWRKRDAGGGFVAVHQLDSADVTNARATQEFGQYESTNGNDLIETFYVYGLIRQESGLEPAVIAFSGTKIKKYKQWSTRARGMALTLPDGRRIKLPLFAHAYRIKTVSEKNAKGDFFNLDITFDGANAEAARLAPNSEAYIAARDFSRTVQGGEAKVDHGAQSQGGVQQEEAKGEIPF